MNNIVLRPLAKIDIKKIWEYTFHNWGLKQADIYTNELGHAIEVLIDNPDIGRSINHIYPRYKLYQFKHHLIIYRLSQFNINVIRVLGEKMNVNEHL